MILDRTYLKWQGFLRVVRSGPALPKVVGVELGDSASIAIRMAKTYPPATSRADAMKMISAVRLGADGL